MKEGEARGRGGQQGAGAGSRGAGRTTWMMMALCSVRAPRTPNSASTTSPYDFFCIRHAHLRGAARRRCKQCPWHVVKPMKL